VAGQQLGDADGFGLAGIGADQVDESFQVTCQTPETGRTK
jgi:hypothetical protein